MTADTSTGVLATLRATPRPVRYLLGGVLINQMGAFVQTFLVLYLIFRGFPLADAGVVLTAYSVGAVFGTLLGGELTQRLGPRVTIAGAMATSALVLAFVPPLAHPKLFGALIAAVMLAGLATQSYRPAAAVMLSDLMPGEYRVMAFSMLRIAMNVGAALSPLIAAGLILVDWNLLLWVDAATALIYALLAFKLLPDVTAGSDGHEAPDGSARSAYAVLLRDRRYLLFLVSGLLSTIIYVQFTVALPLTLRADGYPTLLYSAVLTTSSVVLVLAELKITTYVKRWPGYLAGAIGIAVMGIGTAGYGLPGRSAALVIASTAVFVLGVMISGPTTFAYPATFPAAVQARCVGAHQAVFGLGLAAGPTLGVLAWAWLHHGVWLVCGAVGIVASLLAVWGMREKVAPPPETEPAGGTEPSLAASPTV